MTEAVTAEPRSRKRAIATLVFVVMAAVLLIVAVRLRKSPEERATESLAEFVLSRGTKTKMLPEHLAYFGISVEDPVFHELVAVSDGHRSKAIQVRVRNGSRHVDIFLTELMAGGEGGYFYLTSTHGRLVKAVFLRSEPVPVKDAAQRFEREKEFWIIWQREKLRRAGAGKSR